MNLRIAAVAAVGLAVAMALSVGGCRSSKVSRTGNAEFVILKPTSGSTVTGTAVFRRLEGKWIHLRVEIAGATPGVHAVHIHEFGDCSSPDGKSAGGHWNPTGKSHGKWGAIGGEFHLGDLGNIEVGADGTGYLVRTSDLWEIGGTTLNDVLGKSIIVHEGADDFVSQPTGNAGGRVACGEILRRR